MRATCCASIPDRCDPRSLNEPILEQHRRFVDTTDVVLDTEILEVPIFYNDPWSTETAMRFRDRHQSSTETDLEYISRINGFDSVGGLRLRTLRQSVHRHIHVLRPGQCRVHATGARRHAAGGAEVRAAHGPTPPSGRSVTAARSPRSTPREVQGGYQLVGRAATPVFDLAQKLPDFADDPVLAKAGMVVKYRPIDRDEYDTIRKEVENGTYRYRRVPVEFGLAAIPR